MRLFAESAENFAISTVTATRRPATPEPVMPPTERIAALSLADPEVNPATQRLNRILATLLERQLDTDECIEISNVTWRTARYLHTVLFFQCCGSKYFELGSGSRFLAQFGSGSRVMIFNFEKLFLFLNYKKIFSPEEQSSL